MFNKLLDFSYQRTKKEAFGFYLAYLLLGMLIGGVSALIFAPDGATDADTFQNGMNVGLVVAPLYNLAVGLLVTFSKKEKSFAGVVISLLAAILGYFGGALLGLIPVSYLTTKK